MSDHARDHVTVRECNPMWGHAMRRFILVTVIGVALEPVSSVGLGQTNENGIRLYNKVLQMQQYTQDHSDTNQAMEKYEKALRIFEQVGFRTGIGLCNVQLDHAAREDRMDLYGGYHV